MESNALPQSTIKDDKKLLNRFLQDKNINNHREALSTMLKQKRNDEKEVNKKNPSKLTKNDLRILSDTLRFNIDSNDNEFYKLGVDIFDAIRYLNIKDNIKSHSSDINEQIECENHKKMVEQLILNLLKRKLLFV